MAKPKFYLDKYVPNLEHVFKYYSIKNLIETETGNIINAKYICPLSGSIYDETGLSLALEAKNKNFELTEEHSPPKSLNGRGRCLTMKEANNKSNKIDTRILDFFKQYELVYDNILFSKGKIEQNVKVDIKFNYSDNSLIIKQHGKDIPKIKKLFENRNGGKFNLSFPIFDTNDKLLRAGLVKHAYIIAFSVLGYNFIIDIKTILKPWIFEMINQVLFTDKPNHKLLKGVFIFDEGKFNDNMLGVCYCSVENINFLSVVYDIGKNRPKRVVVLFPISKDANFEYISILNKGKRINFHKLNSISDKPTKEESLRYSSIL